MSVELGLAVKPNYKLISINDMFGDPLTFLTIKKLPSFSAQHYVATRTGSDDGSVGKRCFMKGLHVETEIPLSPFDVTICHHRHPATLLLWHQNSEAIALHDLHESHAYLRSVIVRPTAVEKDYFITHEHLF
jgi:hypothetical protein